MTRDKNESELDSRIWFRDGSYPSFKTYFCIEGGFFKKESVAALFLEIPSLMRETKELSGFKPLGDWKGVSNIEQIEEFKGILLLDTEGVFKFNGEGRFRSIYLMMQSVGGLKLELEAASRIDYNEI